MSSKIYNRLISRQNIYLALYSLNSGIIDEFLLCEEDYSEYLLLQDKFNYLNINKWIERVQDRIEKIIGPNESDNISKSDNYLEANVFFNPKKINTEKTKKHIEFRPLHSATLLDQITMISMLNILIYDFDDSNKLNISEMGNLLPDCFYGNRVSKNPETLFSPWVDQYKKYCNNANSSLSKYKENHEYKYEIDFDLANFFPSINPISLYNYIVQLLPVNYLPEDQIIIKKVIEKLIFIKISNLKTLDEIKRYYREEGKIKNIKGSFVLGLAQGLPHTYFFANLFMIKIKEIYSKEFVSSKMFFYVDDSIIYTSNNISEGAEVLSICANEKIVLSKANEDVVINMNKKIHEMMQNYYLFAQSLPEVIRAFVVLNMDKFEVEIHPFSGKSSIYKIEDYNSGDINIAMIGREVSFFSSNRNKSFTEESDEVIKKKADFLLDSVERKLNQTDKDFSDVYKEKLIRYKKYLKKLTKQIKFRIDGNIESVILNLNNELETLNLRGNNFDADKFIELYTNDILLNDIVFLKNQNNEYNLGNELKKILENIINNLEFINDNLFGYKNVSSSYLYRLIALLKSPKKQRTDNYSINKYYSLKAMVNFKLGLSLDIHNIVKESILTEEIKDFYKLREDFPFDNGQRFSKPENNNVGTINNEKTSPLPDIGISTTDKKYHFIDKYVNEYCIFIETKEKQKLFYKKEENNFSKLIKYVICNSDELYRMLFNTIFSFVFQVEISDDFILNKNSNQLLNYFELRMLIFLRGGNFKVDKLLEHYKECIQVENTRSIDYSILRVLNIFKKYVSNSEYIDTLILAHKYTCDIWKNGSKQLYFYTLHNQEHAISLIMNAIQLTKVIDYLQISKFDYYVLFLSCYLHDISMVTLPDYNKLLDNSFESDSIYSQFDDSLEKLSKSEKLVSYTSPKDIKKLLKDFYLKVESYFENLVRGNHGSDSAIEILEQTELNFISDPIRDFVSEVSKAHVINENEVYKTKSVANDHSISIKFLKILLRLSDVLDMGNSRVSDLFLSRNIENMNSTSRFHGISHSITNKYSIDSYYSYRDTNNVENSLFTKQSIIETVVITIFVDLPQFTKIDSPCCKKMNLESISDNALRIKIKDKNDDSDNICEDNCNFLCKWAVVKNSYLFKELYYLKEYLNTSPSNMYYSDFEVCIQVSNTSKLDNKQFNYLKEYLEKY